jgi:hypothetical protein
MGDKCGCSDSGSNHHTQNIGGRDPDGGSEYTFWGRGEEGAVGENMISPLLLICLLV